MKILRLINIFLQILIIIIKFWKLCEYLSVTKGTISTTFFTEVEQNYTFLLEFIHNAILNHESPAMVGSHQENK